MNPDAITRIHNSFAAQTLMSTFQAELVDVAPGHVRISAPILPNALQQHGYGHAGLTFTLGDVAAGYAALTTMALDMEVVTAEIKINLLAPAIGDRLLASGRVAKSGNRLCVVTGEVHAVHNDKETLIAVLQGTMVPVPVA